MGASRFFLALFITILANFHPSVRGDESKSPKIVIIGAGPAGIAAASKLLEHGFKDVTILEAEDRIGGRVYTTKLGDYNVDLGAQWVHGEEDNAVFKLAYPLGILEKTDKFIEEFFDLLYLDSKGNLLQEHVMQNLTKYFFDLHEGDNERTHYASLGEYVQKTHSDFLIKDILGSCSVFQTKIDVVKNGFDKTFEDFPEILENKRKYLHLLEMQMLGLESALTWYDLTTHGDNYREYEGDTLINWKTRGYSTILDVLMKRFPDAEKELPVLNNTLLNTEVVSIDYSKKTEGSPVSIITSTGQVFQADHVIVTVSLGVLKETHKSLFVPPLPETKVQAIEGIGFGNVAKIFLLFEKPFWDLGEKRSLHYNFIWNDDDRKAVEADPEKGWTIGLTFVVSVNHKPDLLEFWVSGNYAKAMEELPEGKVFNHTVECLHRFLGNVHNVTHPVGMLRTRWRSNPHFRGTYSFPSVETVRRNVNAAMLAESANLHLLFAGEATNINRYSTVDGAIETGWRAADTLIAQYNH